MKIQIIAIILVALFTRHSDASVINVKLGDDVYNGTGVIDGGAIWNYVSLDGPLQPKVRTLSQLYDSDGNRTDVSIEVTYASSFGGSSTTGSTPRELLGSGLYGPFSFTISGLNPSQIYNIYTFHFDKAGHATTTTISGSHSTSQTPLNTRVEDEFYEEGNYLKFTGVQPSLNGQIVGFSNVAWGGLNGIQIEQIPEPSILGLLLGGLMLACLFCKKPWAKPEA